MVFRLKILLICVYVGHDISVIDKDFLEFTKNHSDLIE